MICNDLFMAYSDIKWSRKAECSIGKVDSVGMLGVAPLVLPIRFVKAISLFVEALKVLGFIYWPMASEGCEKYEQGMGLIYINITSSWLVICIPLNPCWCKVSQSRPTFQWISNIYICIHLVLEWCLIAGKVIYRYLWISIHIYGYLYISMNIYRHIQISVNTIKYL